MATKKNHEDKGGLPFTLAFVNRNFAVVQPRLSALTTDMIFHERVAKIRR